MYVQFSKSLSNALIQTKTEIFFRRLRVLFLSAAVMAPTLAHSAPDPSPDPNATTIYLRTSCTIANVDGAGEGTMENCFESMAGQLGVTKWIYARANPQKLLVDIGPGTFGTFSCSMTSAGELSFRGAGSDKTVINGVGNRACSNANWTFSDLTVRGTPGTTSNHAVIWLDAGTSSWNNVILEATGTGASWYDAGGSSNSAAGGLSDGQCLEGEQGTHRFFSVRFITHAASSTGAQGEGSFGFLNRCGDNWLWGSEIVFTPTPGGTGTAVSSEGPASRMHLYGSNIRAEADSTATSGGITAFHVRDGAEIHSHGVGIDVVANPGMTATALNVANGGEMHAFESSYFMPVQADVTVRRIVNDGGTGHIHAPFHWAQHAEAPVVTSVTGADTTIVTNTTDGHPHMLIYDTACASSWFDIMTKGCR